MSKVRLSINIIVAMVALVALFAALSIPQADGRIVAFIVFSILICLQLLLNVTLVKDLLERSSHTRTSKTLLSYKQMLDNGVIDQSEYHFLADPVKHKLFK